MTRDDIIKIAREADFAEGLSDNLTGEVLVWDAETKHLERFAALVAKHERDACLQQIGIIVEAEREACAKVCDETEQPNLYGVRECAAAIRARHQT